MSDKNAWKIWNSGFHVTAPPSDALIIAYGYHDVYGREFVGYPHEILKKIDDNTIVWKYTGIAKERITNEN